MNTPSQEQLDKRYEAAPAQIKELWYKSGPILAAISSKHQLNEGQIEHLVKEAELVVLGFVRKNEFAKNLKESLSVTEEQAGAIAQDVRMLVFDIITSIAYHHENTTATPPKTPHHTPPATPAKPDPYREPIDEPSRNQDNQ